MIEVVAHEGDRHAQLAVRAGQRFHDEVARGAVEVTGRLVGEEHRGPVDQRAGDGHPLLLAAREFRREVPGTIGEVEQGEQGAGALPALATGAPRHQGREVDVLLGGEFGQEGELLEHVAQPLQPEDPSIGLVQGGHVHAVEEDGAGGRPVEESHLAQQRRLSRTALAHDAEHLARLDVERDLAEGPDGDVARTVGPGQRPDLEPRRHRRGPRGRAMHGVWCRIARGRRADGPNRRLRARSVDVRGDLAGVGAGLTGSDAHEHEVPPRNAAPGWRDPVRLAVLGRGAALRSVSASAELVPSGTAYGRARLIAPGRRPPGRGRARAWPVPRAHRSGATAPTDGGASGP